VNPAPPEADGPAADPGSPGGSKTAAVLGIPEGVVAGIAMAGLTLIIGFLGYEMSREHAADLGQLGLSGIASLIIGTLANPQGPWQRRYWWALLGFTFLGALTGALMTGLTDRSAAAPALSIFAAAFFGLLVDGEKLSVGRPGKK
ncbi:hypothetical protein, partial [Kitasatospora sp. NPDC093558]|uniref:hypothetical protein n=1 Tax=Kitasatospora sp. NPDC093558 TaxID=3155201 RepID=UPI00342C8B9F